MSQIRKIAKIITLLMIPVIMVLFFNGSNNRHTHILPNGQLINHAHPFKTDNSSTPFQNHKHTPFELIFLNFLSDIFGLIPFLLVLSTAFFFLSKKVCTPCTRIFIKEAWLENYSGRAPPYFI
ncbi:MAG: hypothetical protein ABFS35_15200 [Bacteroidota bacterium]